MPSSYPVLYRSSIKDELPSQHLAFICALILAFTLTVLMNLKNETADEGFHTPQIWSFYHIEPKIHDSLTMLPVYHAAIASLLKISGFFSVPFARFLHMLLSALTLPLFYALCRRLQQGTPDSRTLLMLSSPIILPFFSLIYTDIPALLLMLLCVYFTVRLKYVAAAFFGLFAILTRQTNLIWVAFCGCYLIALYYQDRGLAGFKDFKTGLLPLFWRLLPYGAVSIIAVLFFLFRGGVAVGDSDQHTIGINLSNLYFMMITFWLLFLPHNILRSREIYLLIKGSPKLWYFLIGLFLLYMATYNNQHQYNSFGLDFYLRNIMLHYTVAFPAAKALTFIPVIWMGMSFYLYWKRAENQLILGLVYFFAALSVVPLPLIEQRYYIVALTMFLIFKPEDERTTDFIALYLYIPANCALLFFIAKQQLFL